MRIALVIVLALLAVAGCKGDSDSKAPESDPAQQAPPPPPDAGPVIDAVRPPPPLPEGEADVEIPLPVLPEE